MLRSMEHGLLVASWSTGQTIVETVDRDGGSSVVASFEGHFDFINGCLTIDDKILHVTERVTSTKNGVIAYRSALHNLENGQSNECFFSSPIDAIFVSTSPKYHMLLLKDKSLLSFSITIDGTKLKRKKRSELQNVVWMDYWDSKLSVITEEKTGFVFSDAKPLDDYSVKKLVSFNVLLSPESKLPDELSMVPTPTANLPIFHNSSYRIFAYQVKDRICLIQQTFTDLTRCLSFEVSVCPGMFRRKIAIPDASGDIPLCCAQFNTIILLFAANSFLVIVDVSRKTPRIVTLKKTFAQCCCGTCAASIPHQGCVVDIDTWDVFSVGITFMYPQLYQKELTQTTLCVFAMLIQRLRDAPEMSNLIRLIETRNDYHDAICFFRYVFSEIGPRDKEILRSMSLGASLTPIKERRKSAKIPHKMEELVRAFEIEFPSSGTRTRAAVFRDIVESKRKIDKNVFDKAFRVLERQNDVMLMTCAAIESWIETHKPSTFWVFVVILTVICEAMECNCWKMPVLIERLSSMVDEIVPKSVKSALRVSGVLAEIEGPENELDFWRCRMKDTSNVSHRLSKHARSVTYH